MTVKLIIASDFVGNPHILKFIEANDGIIEYFKLESQNIDPKDIFGEEFEASSLYEVFLYVSDSWNYEHTECEIDYEVVHRKLIKEVLNGK